MKRTTIADDTPILPWIVADAVARGRGELFSESLVTWLHNRAERLYAKNERFAKGVRSKRGNSGRDYLYMFMEYWTDAYLTDPAKYEAREAQAAAR